MKLTPRQIEVLTETFDNVELGWMTSAQRAGRQRVLDNLKGYNFKTCLIVIGKYRTRQLNLRGLLALQPHYPDQAKIAAAIKARREHEAQLDAQAAAEQQAKAERTRQIQLREEAKMIAKVRHALAMLPGFDVLRYSDEVLLRIGRTITDNFFEPPQPNYTALGFDGPPEDRN